MAFDQTSCFVSILFPVCWDRTQGDFIPKILVGAIEDVTVSDGSWHCSRLHLLTTSHGRALRTTCCSEYVSSLVFQPPRNRKWVRKLRQDKNQQIHELDRSTYTEERWILAQSFRGFSLWLVALLPWGLCVWRQCSNRGGGLWGKGLLLNVKDRCEGRGLDFQCLLWGHTCRDLKPPTRPFFLHCCHLQIIPSLSTWGSRVI